MENEWQIGLAILAVSAILGFVFIRKISNSKGVVDKLFNSIFVLCCALGVITGIAFIVDDASSDIGDGNDYDYEQSSEYYDEEDDGNNVSFRGSYNDMYKGNPCKYKESGDAQTCSERGDCYGGFDSKNRTPSECINCDHSYKYHK